MSAIERILALLVLLALLIGLAYCKGGSTPRKEAREARKETAAVVRSAEVSAGTAQGVDREGAAVRSRAVAADKVIEDATRTPADPAADARILREVDEAYAATVRARCRVQRTSDCDAVPEAAAE